MTIYNINHVISEKMSIILPNGVAKFLFFFSAGTSSSLPIREESGLGVIENDRLKETLGKKVEKS